MQAIKFILIFICLFFYLVLGVLIRLVLIWASPFTVIKVMNRLKFFLMHSFRIIGGLKIEVSGRTNLLREKGLFIISTHVGYLDGVVLGTIVPGSFTTKKEIKNIPFLGRVVSVGGSIFIDRKEKNQIISYVNQMAERLKNGINIFNFPEGHATDGTKILSFFPAFFDAPLKTKSPIVPVTINYRKIDGQPITDYDDVYCYEGCKIVKHLWNLMKFKSIDILVTIHDKIETNGHIGNSKGRKSISELCINRLSTYTNLPISNDHPFQRSGRNGSAKTIARKY